MKKSDIYMLTSVLLFLLAIIIIPVGGFTESNPNNKFYLYGFAAAEINVFISFIVLYFANRKRNTKCG